MKSLSETIYLKSPVFIQNLALSFYGLKLQHIRYGGEYKDYLNEALTHMKYGDRDLNEYINTALKLTIRDAARNVPYYREMFQQLKIKPEDIKTVEDLAKIPLLKKSAIKKDPLKFVNTNYNNRKLICIHTTGTTGTPLKIFCDNRARQTNYAYYDRFLINNHINYKGRRGTFGGRIVVPPQQDKPPFWRYSHFQKNMLFSSYHLTERNIPFYINKLRKFQPDYIDSYPSSLCTIAAHAQKQGLNLEGLTKGITTSAETLFSQQRKIIESAFGVPVVDQYGAAEMCMFIGQCREGKYHIHTDYGLLEVLREDGTKAEPGEEGEIVCTGFINHAMPLIRYSIGDRGILSDRQCKCGSRFPVMEKILGRIDDFIITPDGRKIGRLSPVLKGFPIKEAQYIQETTDELLVLIVKDTGFSHQTEKEIIKELRKRVGMTIALKMKYVDQVKRSSGGKLRSIISKLKQ